MRGFVLSIALANLGTSSASFAAETYQLEKTHADLLLYIDHAGFTKKRR